jgi:phosphoesterase RecJ-like protein
MEEQINKLKSLIDSSGRILITSHISPDPDAVSSVLLLFNVLTASYPDKNIASVLEEKPNTDLSFLSGFDRISFQPLGEAITSQKPDLIVIADAGRLSRCSRNSVLLGDAKLVIIDHHEPTDRDEADLYINNNSPAAVQDVYALIEAAGWELPEGSADIALLGIISDTARFRYDNPSHRETFRIVSKLMDAGASIEKLERKINRYTKPQLEVLSHLSANVIVSDQGYNYSWIDDEFTAKWLSGNKSLSDLKTGCEIFVNQFIRSIGSNSWGFIVYPDLAAGEQHYAASFRSAGDAKNVSVIAKTLGGGGHIPAAGAKFQAGNMQEAVKKVLAAIENTADS